MIEVTWSTPAGAASDARIEAQCALQKQAAQRLHQQQQEQPTGKPLLMSADNPDGRTLEDLLVQIRQELEAKTRKLREQVEIDPFYPAALRRLRVRSQVRENNERIAALLMQAELVQRESLASLGTIGPDPGPLGTPRV